MQETRTPEGTLHKEVFVEGGGKGELAASIGLLRQMNQRLEELRPKGHTLVRRFRIGRNDQCPCESGKKFKHCHINDLPGLVSALEALNAKARRTIADG